MTYALRILASVQKHTTIFGLILFGFIHTAFVHAEVDTSQLQIIDASLVDITIEFDSKDGEDRIHTVTLTNNTGERLRGPIVVEILSAFEKDSSNSDKKGKNRLGKILNEDDVSGLGNPVFLLDIGSLSSGDSTTFILVTRGVKFVKLKVSTFKPAITPPSVSFTSPSPFSLVSNSPIQVSGQVGSTIVSLVINGQSEVFSAGEFLTTVTLHEGKNVLSAQVLDINGDQATANLTIILDQTGPLLTIDSHEDGDTVFTEFVTVTGLVNDAAQDGNVIVTVNNQTATVSGMTYAATIRLQVNANLISVEASDLLGNTSLQQLNLTYIQPIGQRIDLSSGQNQSATINTLLADPLSVQVFDDFGNIAAGIRVIFSVEQGSGSFAGGTRLVIVESGSNGVASLDFTVGSTVGAANQKVKAVADGFNDVVFIASTIGLAGNKINISSGNGQSGLVGEQLSQQLVTRVTDSGSNVVGGSRVEFSVIAGGGSFGNGESTLLVQTDAEGTARVDFILGSVRGAGEQQIGATLLDTEDGNPVTAGFHATAFVAADPALTSVTGVVLDNQDIPIPGVTLRIDGSSLIAITDGQGRFEISGAPVGPVHLLVDGSTASVPGSFASLAFNLITVPGAENAMSSPIFLVDLSRGSRVFAGPDDVVLTLDKFPGFELEIAKDSVTFPDGSMQGFVSATTVNASKVPMAPPDGMQSAFVITIQPAGARFDPPARLTIPNVEGKAPGEQFELFSFDHDLDEFVSIGTGTVSEDGTVVVSNPGVGVVKAGWHLGSQPQETGTVTGTSTQSCDLETVNVSNRTVNVLGDGTWTLDNVPANTGLVRARSTCFSEANTLSGETPYFEVIANATINVGPLQYENPEPIPVSIDVVPATDLSLDIGITSQLSVEATFADSTTLDVSSSAEGTNYTVANSAVAMVGADGLVQAVAVGITVILIDKDGVLTSIGITVNAASNADTDLDGIIDEVELALGLDPLNPVDAEQDFDGDGLSNLDEVTLGTNINLKDTDGDGLDDNLELTTNPLVADSDGDGISDGLEVTLGTDPADPASSNLDAALVGITMSPDNATIVFNSLFNEGLRQLTVTGQLADGSSLDLTANGTTYSSSDFATCSFSATPGEVFAGQAGSCEITATNGSHSATAFMVVSTFTPSSRGFVDISGSAADLAVSGDFVYIASFAAGLTIVDVSSKNTPQVVATYDTLGNAQDVAISGSFAYVANGTAGLLVLDISVPGSPAVMGSLGSLDDANSLVVSGARAYIATSSGVRIVDISNPTNMSLVGSNPISGVGIDVSTARDLLAVATGNDVQILDISNESSPIAVSSVATFGAQDVDFKVDTLLVASLDTSLTSYDVSPATLPDPLPMVDGLTVENAGRLNDIKTVGNHTFGADILFINSVTISDVGAAPNLAANQILDFGNIRDDDGVAVDADTDHVYLLGQQGGQFRLYVGQYFADESNNQFVPLQANPGILEFFGANHFAGEEETEIRVFVRRSLGSQGVVSADYSVTSGSATAGQDFVAVTGTLSWGDGDDTLKSFVIPLLPDTLFEPQEFMMMNLVNATGGAYIGTSSSAVSILEDDLEPGFAGFVFSRVFGMRVDEGVGSLTLDIVRMAGDTGNVSIDYVAPGFGGFGADQIGAAQGTLSWADGDSSRRQITIPILDDTVLETIGRSFVEFSNPTGGLVNLGATEIMVFDDDGGPLAGRLEFSTRNIRAGEAMPGLEFRVLRKGSSFGIVTADYATADFGAGVEGVSYVGTSGTLTWLDGDNSPKSIFVPLVDNADINGGTLVLLELSNATGNAQLGPFTFGIVWDDEFDSDDTDGDGFPNVVDSDDDGDGLSDDIEFANGLDPLVSDVGLDTDGDLFSNIDEVLVYGTDPLDASSFPFTGRLEIQSAFSAVGENETQIEINIVRLGGDFGPASVNYSTEARTALEGLANDFTAVSGTLNWVDGDSTPKSFFIPIVDNVDVENLEYFVARISGATGAELGFDRVLIEINDEDSAPNPGSIRFRHSRLSTEEGAAATYEVVRMGGSLGDVTADYQISGAATVGSDLFNSTGTLLWLDGDMSVRTITVDTIDDAEEEVTELFNIDLVNLSGNVRAIGTTSEGILDNDSTSAGGLVGFSKNVFFVVEGEAFAEATFHRIGGRSGDSGNISLQNFFFNLPPFGASVAGEDYVNTFANFQFGDGDVSLKKHLVPLIDDNVDEGRTVELFLSHMFIDSPGVVNADRPGDSQQDFGTFVVFDDDQPVDGGTIGLSQAAYTVSETNPVFEIQRVGGETGAASVDVSVTGAGATNETYTVLFHIDRSGTQSFTLGVDTNVAGDRTVNIALTGLQGIATPGILTATVTIKEDTDGDGVYDDIDAFPLDANETVDTDGDLVGDNTDTDDDGDGLEDGFEVLIGTDPLVVTIIDPNLEVCIAEHAQAFGITSVDQFDSLDCADRDIESVSGIEGMFNLNAINFSGNLITDVSPVASLMSLGNVNFSHNMLVDISPLSGLNNVGYLELYFNQINSLVGVPANVHWLGIGENNISDISPLSDNAVLDGLFINNNNLVDISGLSGLNLNNVDFGGNQISDVSVLGTMPNLQYISLWGNPVSDSSVVLLAGYTDLHHFNLDNTGVSVLPPLPSSMRSLNAQDNSISDITGLEGLGLMENVNLWNNHITVLPDMSGLTTLTNINVSNNAITDFSPLAPLQASLPPGSVFTDEGRPALTSISTSQIGSLDLTANTCFDVTLTEFDAHLSYVSPVNDSEFGNYLDGVNPNTICFHPNAAAGTWNISRLDGNGFTYNEFAIAHFGFNRPITVVNVNEDIDAPVVSSILPTPQVIDLDAGPALIAINVSATDAGAGTINVAHGYQDTNGDHQNSCCSGLIPVSVSTSPGVLHLVHVNVFDEVNNQTIFDRSDLLAFGADPDIVVGGVNPPVFTLIAGEWFSSQGNWDGAPGNPAYRFTVTGASSSVVVIVLEHDAGDPVTLDLFDASGNRIARDDQYRPRSIVGANLSAGDYFVIAQNNHGGNGTFTITLEGNDVINVVLDSDQDGSPDTVDLDDDGDGISDIDEIAVGMNPLDFSDPDQDIDGDGFTNRQELLAGSDLGDSLSLPGLIADLVFADSNLATCVLNTGANRVTDLSSLDCFNQGISDVTGIGALAVLDALHLSGNDITDITEIGQLTLLTYLDVSSNRITSLPALSTTLTDLNARNNQIASLVGIDSLINLGWINFDRNLLSDSSITSLALMTSLWGISLNNNQISSLVSIPNGLNSLSVGDNQISVLNDLSDNTELSGLDLWNNNISVITPLGNLTLLSSVNFGGNDITDVSTLGPSNMPDLQYISLWGNPILDATVLTGYTELHSLNLDGTGITILPVLPASLRDIRANNSQVSDISGIAGLSNLTSVAFSDNHIASLPDLSGLTSIVNFEINVNAISELDLAALGDLPVGANINSDIGRPPITGITLPSSNVDLDSNVCFNITVSGFDGGITYGNSINASMFSAGYGDGQEATVCLHSNAANGIWDITRLDTNNGFSYNQFAINQLGFNRPVTISGGVEDLAAPVVTSIAPTPQIINLDNGPGLIDLGVVATDAVSGVTNVAVSYEDTEQQHRNSCCAGVIPVSVSTAPGVLRIRDVNVFDESNNQTLFQRSRLLAFGVDPDIVVNSTNPPVFTPIAGVWFNSEGNHDGALGNPAYRFTVTGVGGVAVIVAEHDNMEPVTLDLFDASGNRIVREDQYTPRSTIGADLPVGDYVVLVQNLHGGSGTFVLTIEGNNVVNVLLDSDQDGTVDTLDLDDDDDGITDLVELSVGMNPVDYTDPELDFDSDGFTNRQELLSGSDINDGGSVPTEIVNLVFPDANLGNCVSATGAVFVTDVTFLDCSNSGVSDLTQINKLVSLDSLFLARNDIVDISAISQLTLLRYLDISANRVSDISALPASLVDLNAWDNQISSLTGIDALVNLGTIVLDRNLLTDSAITPLASMASLGNLSLSSNQIGSLASIPSGVHWLQVGDNNISSLIDIADNTLLEGLELWSNNISVLTPLSGLTKLFSINLGANAVTDVTVLAGMPNLQYISLWNNGLTNAHLLTGFNELHSLDLTETGITSLPSLPNSLISLRADNNAITDVTDLGNGLGNLNDVSLWNNHISVLPDLSGLVSLTHFNLSNNAITDYNALGGLPGGLAPESTFTDQARPIITGLTASKGTLDLAINTCFDVTLTGFDAHLSYGAPSGDVEFGTHAGDAQLSTICFHPNAADGIWNINRLDTNDGFTFNEFAISAFGFNHPVDVISANEDATAPVVTSVAPSPQVINLDAGPALIDLNVVAIDAGTGVAGINAWVENTDGIVFHPCCDGIIPISVTTDPGVLRITGIHVFDAVNNQTFLDRTALLGMGADPEIVISANNPPVFTPIAGLWVNSEGSHDGALGNPAYRFTVSGVGGVVVIVAQNDSPSDPIVLDLFDDTATRITRADSYQPKAILGADLAPGDYFVLVQNNHALSGTFNITFEGDVTDVKLDSDQDGIPDLDDPDDDGDGVPDGVDTAPLDWAVP